MDRKTSNGNESAASVTQDVAGRYSNDIESIKDALTTIRGEIAKIFETSVHAGKTTKELAGKGIRTATSTLSDKGAELGDVGHDALAHIKDVVRNNPGTSALIAFGVGYIAAHMLRR